MRILLIEDDRKAARLLSGGLQEEGFIVDVAHTAEEGDELAFSVDYDVIVLVHMGNLRRKVDSPGVQPLIETVRGRGFRLGGQQGERAYSA